MEEGGLDEAILAFASHCPGLQDVLVIPGELSSPVTPASLLHLATHCGAHLRRLCMELEVCPCAPDAALDTLAANCQHIETLRLCFDQASSAALARLIAAQHCLREVGVTSDRGDDAVLRAIAQHGAHLTGLEMPSHGNYTAQGLNALVQSCTALRTVYLSWPYAHIPEDFVERWQQVRPSMECKSDSYGVPFWDNK